MTHLDASGPDRADRTAVEHGSITVDGSAMVLSGEIDYLVVQDWYDRFGQPPAVQVIDAAEVEFLASAGVVLIVKVVRAAAPARVQLRRPTRPARRPLEAMGLTSLMDVVVD